MKTTFIIIILAVLLAACQTNYQYHYNYHTPEVAEEGLEIASALEVGLDTSYLCEMVDRIWANKYDQVHSILVYKDNKLVFEEYMQGNKYYYNGPYFYGERIQWHRDSLHMIMSCTKSVTSAIIGIAVDQGYIDVHESIFTYLPDHQQLKTKEKAQITVEHLLSMSSGLQWDEWSASHNTAENDIDNIYLNGQKDPVALILSKELIHTPGESFTYSGGNMIILGEILRNATGKNILDFGKQYLFHPLGIDSVYWYQFENGAFACDGSIALRPRDMLKIGICFLNEGKWGDEQIISKEWVEKSKSVYGNNTGINIPLDDTGRNGYGYTWWINEISGGGKEAKIFQASGWGGQEIIVIPKYNMVVVFTGGNYVVKKHIYDMLEGYILAGIME